MNENQSRTPKIMLQGRREVQKMTAVQLREALQLPISKDQNMDKLLVTTLRNLYELSLQYNINVYCNGKHIKVKKSGVDYANKGWLIQPSRRAA